MEAAASNNYAASKPPSEVSSLSILDSLARLAELDLDLHFGSLSERDPIILMPFYSILENKASQQGKDVAGRGKRRKINNLL